LSKTDFHSRKSIRLHDFNYARRGLYFITICTHNRQNLFGKVKAGKIELNSVGQIVKKCWKNVPNHYPNIVLDEFVIMPNHIHGIIQIIADQNTVGVQNIEPLPRQNKYQHIIPGSVGAILRGFKIGVTKWCRTNMEIYSV